MKKTKGIDKLMRKATAELAQQFHQRNTNTRTQHQHTHAHKHHIHTYVYVRASESNYQSHQRSNKKSAHVAATCSDMFLLLFTVRRRNLLKGES